MLHRVTLFATLALALVTPAFAFQKFEEYRIFGSEIKSVAIGPQEEEAPASLILTLVDQEGGTEKLTLESDDLVDNCMATIDSVIGDKNQYVQITVQLTTETMNGILIVGCLTVRAP